MDYGNIIISTCVAFLGLFALWLVIMNVLEWRNSSFRFFQTRKGLWVQSGFDQVIQENWYIAKNLGWLEMGGKIIDEDISVHDSFKIDIDKYRIGNTCVIHKMIRDQFKGQNGPLLINGRTNIFLVAKHDEQGFWVVDVFWDKNSKEWQVHYFDFNHVKTLHAGSQMFVLL